MTGRLALPGWLRPAHPIVRAEVARWKRSPAWRGVWLVVPGATLLVALAPAACVMLMGLVIVPITSATGWVLTLGGTVTAALAAASALGGWFNELAAGIIGASLIARERESQTWSFLRLTSLTSTEIAGGKLAALLSLLAWPMHFVAALRLLALGVGALSAVAAILVSRLPLNEVVAGLGAIAQAPADLLSLGLGGLAGVILYVGGWLVQPYFGVAYNAGVGLAVSTLVRSRGAAVVLVFVTHFILGLALYAPAQQVFSLFMLLPVMGQAGPSPLWLVTLVVAPIALQAALQVGVLVACVIVAVARLEHLSD